MDIDLQSAMWPCGVVRQRYQKLNGLLYPTSNINNTSNKPARREVTSRHGASRYAGLILIHRFPLSLLFHNHRSLPVSIRGYHLQTFLTLLWLPFTSFNPLCRVRVFLPSLLSLHSIPLNPSTLFLSRTSFY